jgi:hypothetical protein
MQNRLRVVVDGKVIWDGDTANITFKTDQMVKPKMNPLSLSYSTAEEIMGTDMYFDVEPFNMHTVDIETINFTDEVYKNKVIYQAGKAVREENKEGPPPTNEEVADVLEAAADAFLTEGWCQGAYHATPEFMEELNKVKLFGEC